MTTVGETLTRRNFGHHTQYEQLLDLLTVERMGSYFDAARGDTESAFSLYEWNMEASAAIMSTTGMVEVLVRNALDRQLTLWQQDREHPSDWLDLGVLDQHAKQDIAQARRRASQRNGTPTHGKIVAELPFGFWRYLVASRYLTTLWIPAGQHAFPGGTRDARQRRADVERILKGLHLVRNRAAHHEPIHRRDLDKDLRDSVTVAGWVHPVGAEWITARSPLPRVEAVRPIPR